MRNFLIGVLITWLVIVGLIIQHDKETSGMSSDDTGSVASNRVKIVFWHAMGGPLGRVMNDMVARYNASQDKYYVKSICMGGYDTLAKKILASLVAKEAPDISQNYETLTKKFIKHKKIVCLDDLIASESENIKDDIIPVLLANNTFDGKLYSFPFNKSVPVLYYNKDLFKKVGLDPEHPPETLYELASYAKIITDYHQNTPGEDKSVYGFGTSKANVWMFQNRVLQFGGQILSDDGKKCMLDQPPAIQALTFVQDMLKAKIAREGQGFDHQNDFKAKKVGMIESSIVSKIYMEPGLEFTLGVAPLPMQVKKGVILSGSNINIFNNGDPEKIKGAWDFIKWFTNTENGAEWSVRTTYMPVRKSSLTSKYFLDAQAKDPNLKAPYVQLDYCHFEPRLTVWFEIRDLMADHLEEATLKKGPPEKYCKEMTSDINAILKHATQ